MREMRRTANDKGRGGERGEPIPLGRVYISLGKKGGKLNQPVRERNAPISRGNFEEAKLPRWEGASKRKEDPDPSANILISAW